MTTAIAMSDHVSYEMRDNVAVITIDRPHKRNALDTATVNGLGDFFAAPPADVASAVITTSGEHFSAGLDLSELKEATVMEGLEHSRSWHRPFSNIELGRIPVVSALKGAVIGAGLELALCTHVRVSEPSTFYALPEGSRGIFVGGGASVRLPKIVGVACMADMMLTGRVITAEEGLALGISRYLVGEGDGLDKAIALAARIAENAPATNYAIVQALPRIAEMGPHEGLFVESLMSAICQSTDEAKANLAAFLEGRGAKVGENGSPS